MGNVIKIRRDTEGPIGLMWDRMEFARWKFEFNNAIAEENWNRANSLESSRELIKSPTKTNDPEGIVFNASIRSESRLLVEMGVRMEFAAWVSEIRDAAERGDIVRVLEMEEELNHIGTNNVVD